jgi:hypothetical protein
MATASERRALGSARQFRYIACGSTHMEGSAPMSPSPPVRGAEATTAHAAADRQWFIISRLGEYAGEARANLLRIIAIGAFYVIELLNYHGLHFGPVDFPATVDLKFHQAATGLAVAWILVALATLLSLRLQFFPAWLKYATTLSDVVLLTAILTLADGPRSPLLVGYFLVIALAALRFQLRLVWCATIAAMAGYLFLAGFARWFAVDRNLAVPRYYELIMLLALALHGVVIGQVIRRVRSMAEDFARRVGEES